MSQGAETSFQCWLECKSVRLPGSISESGRNPRSLWDVVIDDGAQVCVRYADSLVPYAVACLFELALVFFVFSLDCCEFVQSVACKESLWLVTWPVYAQLTVVEVAAQPPSSAVVRMCGGLRPQPPPLRTKSTLLSEREHLFLWCRFLLTAVLALSNGKCKLPWTYSIPPIPGRMWRVWSHWLGLGLAVRSASRPTVNCSDETVYYNRLPTVLLILKLLYSIFSCIFVCLEFPSLSVMSV